MQSEGHTAVGAQLTVFPSIDGLSRNSIMRVNVL